MLKRHVFANPRLVQIAMWTRIGYGARPEATLTETNPEDQAFERLLDYAKYGTTMPDVRMKAELEALYELPFTNARTRRFYELKHTLGMGYRL